MGQALNNPTLITKLHLPSDTNNKCKLGFSWDIKVRMFPCHTLHPDLISLLLTIFLYIFFCSFKDFLALHSSHLKL